MTGGRTLRLTERSDTPGSIRPKRIRLLKTATGSVLGTTLLVVLIKRGLPRRS